jgi:hypothetical protein
MLGLELVQDLARPASHCGHDLVPRPLDEGTHIGAAGRRHLVAGNIGHDPLRLEQPDVHDHNGPRPLFQTGSEKRDLASLGV